MKEDNEYDKQALKFLSETKTEMIISFLKYGKHFIDDKDERDIYQITLKRGERIYTFNFGQSIIHSGRYTYYSSAKGRIVSNDKKQLNKLAGRTLSLGECKINDEQREPSAYDILASLIKNNPQSFKDFCADYGYFEDSIKTKKVYDAVLDEWQNLERLYSEEELEMLRDIQ
jgi:hypothetical protein